MAADPKPAKKKSKRVGIPEICKDLGISRSLAYQMLREGRIPHIALGRRRRIIPRSAYEKWFDSCGAAVKGAA